MKHDIQVSVFLPHDLVLALTAAGDLKGTLSERLRAQLAKSPAPKAAAFLFDSDSVIEDFTAQAMEVVKRLPAGVTFRLKDLVDVSDLNRTFVQSCGRLFKAQVQETGWAELHDARNNGVVYIRTSKKAWPQK